MRSAASFGAALGHEAPAIPSHADAALIAEVLAEYGRATRERMRRYMPSGEANAYLYDLLADYPARGGKMLRSALCIATARAWGASVEDALPSAVSIELMHNALLIHDDIEDDSERRRGAPTLHVKHGVPLAINAGDAMGLLALRPLKDNAARLGAHVARTVFEETEHVAWQSAEGQALELGWQRDGRVDLGIDDYLRMVLQKTCWLTTIHPLRVGALIGSRGRADLAPLSRLGFFAGAAFQIQDDALNFEGGADYDKDVDGDLREGKRTLMLLHALRRLPARERERLKRFIVLPRGERTAAEIAFARRALQRTGAVGHARAVAHGLAGAALREFDRSMGSLPPQRDLRFVRHLILWLVQRGH